jgi:hypothetical protein
MKARLPQLRHLLSLQASVTPDNTYLIHYDAEGSREEYSFARFNARVHQAADDRVRVMMRLPKA